MKLKLGRKGQGFNETIAIVYIIFLAFVTISLVFLLRHTIFLFADTSRTEADTYLNFILYSREGLSYYDPDIDRVYPGVIDRARFVPGTIESGLSFQGVRADKELPAAKFELYNLRTGAVQQLYWNEQWFLRLEPKSGLFGTGSPNQVTKSFPIIIKNDTVEDPGLLAVEVIVPR